ncbi:hypothetical protein [Novosphingobium sp. HII-3]|uniref:hypothetical protein n=1 Tax=Novosphingobium sp. HII-3 TaxID=2075565 RepID=UPI001304B2FE|nr:hypothetical protein [Novosphingobium sp. HII-3]
MAVRSVLLPAGSLAHRLHNCEPWERKRYDEWRDERDAWLARYEAEHGAGALYAHYLAGDERATSAPALWPLSLRLKLFPPVPFEPVGAGGDVGQRLADRWNELIQNQDERPSLLISRENRA